MSFSGEQTLKNELVKLWQKKWLVLGATVAGGLLMFIYMLPAITPPEFQSTGALVPPSMQDVKSLNFLKLKYSGFGAAEVEDLERVSSALESDTAFRVMVKKFNLEKHYEVDDISDPARRDKALRETYNSKVKIQLSANSAVEIQVFDTDPKVASAMVNAFIAYADSFVESIAQRKEGIKNLEESLARWDAQRLKLQDTLAFYRTKYRIYHLDYLSEEISRAIQPFFQRENFHVNYDKVQSAEHFQRYIEGHIAEMTNELIFRKENLKTYPSLNNVVAYGVTPHSKARPKRLIYIALGLFFGFVFSSLFVVFTTKNRND